MFFNKQIFFIQSLPIHNSPVPRCPTSPKSPIKSNFFSPNLQRRMSEGLAKDNALPTSPNSPIKSKFFSPNLQRRISEGSAKDERRMSEG